MKRERTKVCIVLLCIMAVFALVVPAGAQESGGAEPVATEEVTLEPVTVESRREVLADRDSEIVEVDDNAKPVVSTVPEVLDKTPGVSIQNRGILTPKSSQVRLRGLDETRTLILLDGRPLNGAGVYGGFFVDWSALSLLPYERIDVGRGAFSARYGNTLGGTIDLVPAIPAEDWDIQAFSGYKRFDTFASGGYASGRYGPFGAALSLGANSTDGHLRNSEVERYDFGGDFYYFFGGDGQLKASVTHTKGDYNMPVENFDDLSYYDPDYPESSGSRLIGPGIQFPGNDRHGDNSFYTKYRTQLDLAFRKRLAGVDTEAKLYYHNEERDDVITSVALEETVLERESTPDRSWGWLMNLGRTLGRHDIGLGAEGNYLGYGKVENTFLLPDYWQKTPMDGDDEWDATRRHGVYVDDTWSLLDNLDMYAGLRYENYHGNRKADRVKGYNDSGKPQGFEEIVIEYDDEAWLPKVGAVYRPADWLAVHGRFARATRMPDNPAFYWYYGGYRPEVDPRFDVVRKDLSMEDALQYETGLTFTPSPRFEFGVKYYYYDVDDYIRWIFGYAPSRVVYNIDKVTFEGIELDGKAKLWKDLYAFANFTYQTTEKTGDVLDASNDLSDELSELPPYQFNWGLQYEREDGALGKFTCRWTGPRETPVLESSTDPRAGGSNAPDGTPIGSLTRLETLDSFVTFDMLLKYPVWKKGVEGYLSFGVENIGDVKYVEEYDFPAPGRIFSVGAEVKF